MPDINAETEAVIHRLRHPVSLEEALEALEEAIRIIERLDPVSKLTRDLKDATATLTNAEARFLVDAYYSMQHDRIRAAHQLRTLAQSTDEPDKPVEPHRIMVWLAEQRETLEKQVRGALHLYARKKPVGQWCLSITGIGPVITAGLLCNIDIRKAPTVGHIWRFAGLDPTVVWKKETKRPWNGALKRLCFLIGESFVKVSNNDNDVYGKIYKVRKEYEQAKNEALDYKDQAEASLANKRFGDDTQAKAWYLKGMLPPARIHRRSARYATKIFLSDLHCVWHYSEFGELPPKPFVIEHLGHVHYEGPPNTEMITGLSVALNLAGRPSRSP